MTKLTGQSTLEIEDQRRENQGRNSCEKPQRLSVAFWSTCRAMASGILAEVRLLLLELSFGSSLMLIARSFLWSACSSNIWLQLQLVCIFRGFLESALLYRTRFIGGKVAATNSIVNHLRNMQNSPSVYNSSGDLGLLYQGSPMQPVKRTGV